MTDLIFVSNFQFDLSSKPWEEDATPLIKTLQAMVGSKSISNESSASDKNTIDEKLDSLHLPIKPSTRFEVGSTK